MSAIPAPMNWKMNTITASSTGTSSSDNGAHGTKKLLLNTKVCEDFAY
jgi:hypothetical protein